MLNLIKYEFIRKYKLIAITIITALALNIFLITRGVGGSATFLVLLPLVLSVLFIADIVKMYSDDLNNKTGYMLFMTPNSGYKIISSKLLTAVIEGFGLLLIYFLFFLLNGFYIVLSIGEAVNFASIIDVINKIFSEGNDFNILNLLMLLFAILVFIIAFITTVYTAITIRKSLFSEIKFGGLFSFIIFIFINWMIINISGWFYGFISNIPPFHESMNTITSTGRFIPEALMMVFLPMIVVSILQIIALTGLSGYLLEEKINL